jgi:amino acid adenylation domain-containing protein
MIAPVHLDWFAAPQGIPLDRNGPVSLHYQPPVSDFVEQSVAALLATVAGRMPDATALSDGNETLTYAQVAAQAQRLAARISVEVPAWRGVAVLLPNGPASVIALLACLVAGRVCLVLNADHPTERNAAILHEAGAFASIVPEASALADMDGAAVLHTIPFESAAPAAGREATLAAAPFGPDEPAVVLYTSGSTGQPKGIVLSQRTVLSRAANNINAMHLRPADRFLSLGALGTTAGLVATLMALLCGTPQYVLSASGSGIRRLLELIRAERVTVMWGVPVLLRVLFDAPGAASAVASLRLIRTFGEKLLQVDLQAWRTVLPPACHVAITYGQTEVTVAQWIVPPGFTSDDAILPVGYLLPEHRYAILDEVGQAVAAGEVGELVVRGLCVASGEWRHGACETGRASPDPLHPMERILPTGDLVRLRADALLEVVGRRDRQVKVRGQRVEPAEIEDFLRRLPGVADAAVAARRRAEDADLLVFLVTTARVDVGLADRVRAALQRGLPGYMQPRRIMCLATLPRLPDGKIDEAALLARASADHEVIDAGGGPVGR